MLQCTITCYDSSPLSFGGMLEKLKAQLAKFALALKTKFARWFLRKKPLPSGGWSRGEHGESAGRLSFAPWVSTHRGYRLYSPVHASKRLPLLVMLHGCKQDPEAFAAGTRINHFADKQRFYVLYPEQGRLANPYRCWNWFDPRSHHGRGEAAIVAGMVRKVLNDHHIDPARVYVAGISAGGALASVLASCYADLFAACAIHSGLMFQAASSPAAAMSVMQNGSQRDPEKAGDDAFELSGGKVDSMPAMVIQGDADDTVHPVNAEQIVTQFLAMNRHGGAPRTTEQSNGSGYPYQVREYGPQTVPLLRYVKIKGMGHAWSGGNSNYPFNDAKGPDASAMMMEFFALHRRENFD